MYKEGTIRYLTNHNCLSEGFDDDNTKVIVNGRPLRSWLVYTQIVGRATRPHKSLMKALSEAKSASERRELIKNSSKPGAMIVDLAGVNHKLIITATDILGGRVSDEALSLAKSRIEKSAKPADVDKELEKAERELQAKKLAEKEVKEQKSREHREGVIVKANLIGKAIDPFGISDGVSKREPAWFAGKLISDPQKKTLIKFGIPENELQGISRHKASVMIDTCLDRIKQGRCGYRLSRLMIKHGFDPNCSQKEAIEIVTMLKANGWKRPESVT
jgi:superfamily II DNA or RNA helicase